MKRLIVNADDFGLTNGCNLGIIEAMKFGIVSSTTLMINMPNAIEAVTLAQENNISTIGLHLTLTCGEPLSPKNEVASLVDNNGNFYKRSKSLLPIMDLSEVEYELRNQIVAFIKTGLKLSHLDSHHHIHMYDGIREIVAKLALEFDVPLRHANNECKCIYQEMGIKTTDYFTWEFYGEKATINNFKKLINDFDDGIMEIMVHPAFLDQELMKHSTYNLQRENEYKILTSTEIKELIVEEGIELISFNDLRNKK
ncbi:chitin disaccharide deacetylase [Alkaliphilus peptidifermentans]|uniref:Carbohydrate deacetylase n=1 Tax=Alkaliphilus peptidifermentans DSM 18978 TaxID=1120976 RepID=A0A1G5KMV6_9FIRM|nr:chitin disaccharide deacetylase [Alkaliphilus peptidifermentans]SCZ02003.1 hypothetical protein SAMN03080606_03624 [Alkaliphilus peptidifermentans DSM 18978]